MNHVCNDHVLFVFGRWENPYATAAEILQWLNSWMSGHIEEAWDYMAYICLCGYMCGSRTCRPRLFWWSTPPVCPLHGTEMMHASRLFNDRKLLERFTDEFAKKLLTLEIAAKRYAGRPPDEWRLCLPPAVEIAFDDDPTYFRYTWWRNAMEAYLHRLEDREVLSYLRRAAESLRLELVVKIQHAAAGAVYDEEKDVYRIVEKP